MAEKQADAQRLQAREEKRADEKQAEKRRADEIEIQIAKIEADKELALKELELKAQQDQASTSLEATPPPCNKDANSPKPPSFINEKDELDSYLLRFEHLFATITKADSYNGG